MFGFYFGAGVHDSKVPCRSGDYILRGGPRYLCVLSVEPAAWHLSGTDNFDASPILSESLCILDLVPLLIIQ